MNLRQVLGKNRRSSDEEINIVPVMNLFMILIPFLLLTATFVKLAIIDLALPTLDGSEIVSGEPQIEDLTVMVIAIDTKGFTIKTSDKSYPLIPMRTGEYDYQELSRQLTEIKRLFPRLEDVVISPTSEVRYQIIVKVLDYCREIGFPNFSISG